MALIGFFGTLGYSIMLMYMLLDFEANRKRHNYLMGLFMAFILVCGVFVWVCLGYQSFMILYPIFVQAPLFISAYVLILRFFKQTRQQLIMKSEQEVLKTQLSAAQAHLAALKESETKTLIYRHDLYHHLYLINSYLADNKLNEAKKYIAEAEKSIDNTETIKYCDNDAVNLILSSNIKRAEQENIVVESRVDITEDCHVSDMDLCIILSNAIENAINACINITDSSDRKITISCRSKIDKLFIQVTNNFIGEVKFADDMPIRTEENHGFGTRSIASTVQKYNGLCSFTTEDGVFKVRIIL